MSGNPFRKPQQANPAASERSAAYDPATTVTEVTYPSNTSRLEDENTKQSSAYASHRSSPQSPPPGLEAESQPVHDGEALARRISAGSHSGSPPPSAVAAAQLPRSEPDESEDPFDRDSSSSDDDKGPENPDHSSMSRLGLTDAIVARNTRRNSMDASLADPPADSPLTRSRRPNPFQKTLATMDHSVKHVSFSEERPTVIDEQISSSRGAARGGAMDVDDFKRLLMTGSAKPSEDAIESRSPELPATGLPPLSSPPARQVETTSVEEKKKPPPPPKSRHGKAMPVKAESRQPQTVSFSDFSPSFASQGPTISKGSTTSTLGKSTSSLAESQPTSAFAAQRPLSSNSHEADPRYSPLSASPSEGAHLTSRRPENLRRISPTSEPARLQDQSAASRPSTSTSVESSASANYRNSPLGSSSPAISAAVPMPNASGTDLTRSNSNSSSKPPPPPPTRRTGHANAAAGSTSDSSLAQPSRHESPPITSPPSRPRRTSSSTSSSLRNFATMPPPPTPPRRRGGAGTGTPTVLPHRSSSTENSRVIHADLVHSDARGGDVAVVSPGIEQSSTRGILLSKEPDEIEDDATTGGSSKVERLPAQMQPQDTNNPASDVLADMTAFQEEIDALRERYGSPSQK